MTTIMLEKRTAVGVLEGIAEQPCLQKRDHGIERRCAEMWPASWDSWCPACRAAVWLSSQEKAS